MVLCLLFAAAQSFEWLAVMRFLLGFVGAGFVIGIRLVSEWFPAREVGIAEGIYGGWGNFGAAVASMSMPILALAFGGDDGWRYAIGSTGVIAIIYSVIFYRGVRDTPEGSTYFKPKSRWFRSHNKRRLCVLCLDECAIVFSLGVVDMAFIT